MKTLLTRTITGTLLVSIIILSIIFSSLSFLALFSIILSLTLYEFYKIVSNRQVRPNVPLGIFSGLVIFWISFLYSIKIAPPELLVAIIPLFILIFVHELYRLKKHPFTNISMTFLGLIYIAIPFSILNFFVFKNIQQPHEIIVVDSSIDFVNDIVNYFLFLKPGSEITYNWEILLAFLIFIWVYDSVAYLFGVSLGRHPLFKSISPKKSWEGLIGGMAFTPITAYGLYKTVGIMSYSQWIVFGFIIVISATFGDLIESMLKRGMGIKDSGKILPGHGGLLDRFDSVLIAAPIAYLYLELNL